MPSTEAPTWWADVQQDREDLGQRPADSWIDDDIDFTPRRRRITGAPGGAARRAEAAAPGSPATPRRTVTVTGRPDGVAALPRIADDRRSTRRTQARVGHRPDRIALWAAVLGFFLILVAASSSEAATSLGDRTLKPGMEGRDVRQLQGRLKGLGFLDAPATAHFGSLTKKAVTRYQRSRCLTSDGIAGPSTIRALRQGRRACRRGQGGSKLSRRAYLRVQLGERTLARGMAGRDVRTLQRLLRVHSTGVFGPITRRAVRRFQANAGLGVDGAVGPATRAALIQHRMKPRVATWYGPGLYGNRTACGARLTTKLRGVAHKKLPCGTPVTLYHGGRFVTVRVVDRGPYTKGVTFDLTAATARSLGLSATETVRAAY